MLGPFLCALVISLFHASQARTKAYETLLGPNAVNRYCGMEGDQCLTNLNCCPEYECNYRLECQMKSERNAISSWGPEKRCTSDNECPNGLCCRGSLYQGVCTLDCERTTELTNPPSWRYNRYRFQNWGNRRRRGDWV
ncbi:hypothetical protein EG68_01032 [Paragonimus skrjabini miyazakii]|uniref:Ixodegrin B n=1 Tax=Paragonimus skrjabini miyazakii TaxID=59628 RepID=A0A8S9Z2Y2_9TREM|nr:hypothetical protein EG68_01032 [Paragonimus skrjabini miyazakii]